MANCRGCNAPIMWAITEEGKRAPLDITPSTAGNVLAWASQKEMRCATFAGDTLAALVAHGVPLRTNHFMTCPVADRFRPSQLAMGNDGT